jgi:biotin carboxylase
VELVYFPGGPGIRVDSHIYPGFLVSPYYDSMIAKIVAHGRDREEAIGRMRRALEELIIEGIETTAPFHQGVLASERFSSGDVHTGFIDEFSW